MRSTIKKLIKQLDSDLEFSGPIFEFGSLQPKGQERQSIRELFSNREYIGCDAQAGPGVDKVLDLHALNLPDNSAGTVIVLDTVEHVKYFWKAVHEIHRILKPGGVAIVTSVMYFPIHNFPSDYWRFTPDGFRAMTEIFTESFVEFSGLKDFPHTVVAVCSKGSISKNQKSKIQKSLSDWKRLHSQSWKELSTLLLPPILLTPLYKFYVRYLEKR